jgi:Zn-dependent M28 family amino/carboxypeptidase
VFSVAAQVVQNPGLRGKCAFVLFDNEEWFLVGSSAFAKWRKKTYPDKQFSQVFNMDCIADGDVLVLAAKREFEGLLELAGAMKAEGFTVAIKYSKMVYMSDHAVFKRGVMLSFLKRSKAGPLYIPRIHTRTDTFCDLDNLEKLGGAVYRHIGKIAN